MGRHLCPTDRVPQPESSADRGRSVVRTRASVPVESTPLVERKTGRFRPEGDVPEKTVAVDAETQSRSWRSCLLQRSAQKLADSPVSTGDQPKASVVVEREGSRLVYGAIVG